MFSHILFLWARLVLDSCWFVSDSCWFVLTTVGFVLIRDKLVLIRVDSCWFVLTCVDTHVLELDLIEKQVSHYITFLDVFISGIHNLILIFQTYHKSIYAGLLLNSKSFKSFSYKISLIKCLVDRSFKFVTIGTLFMMT